jgi:AraC-like DNA-binding protein
MKPLEARAAGEVVNGSIKMWRPWQIKQFELLQGVALTNAWAHRSYTESYMIVALQSGVGDVQYRNARERISATDGTFYVFEPGEICICQSKDVTFHGLCVDPAWLQQIATVLTQRERSPYHFPSQSLFDPSLSRILREIAVSSQTSISRLQQGELLLSFAQILLAHAEEPGALPQLGREHPAVKRAQEYLQAYYAEAITLQALAQEVGLSPFHLTRVFRQAVGLPPHAYQIQVRLAHARTLLAQGFEVGYVAAETGFTDQAHFARQFRHHFLMPPASYRKTARFFSPAFP